MPLFSVSSPPSAPNGSKSATDVKLMMRVCPLTLLTVLLAILAGCAQDQLPCARNVSRQLFQTQRQKFLSLFRSRFCFTQPAQLTLLLLPCATQISFWLAF